MSNIFSWIKKTKNNNVMNYEEGTKCYKNFYEPKDKNEKVKPTEMTIKYYDLSTDFYEVWWGESFHFAPRFINESFNESIIRHEHYLALKLGLKENHNVLDIGSGVMGPARNITRLSSANIIGLNTNKYQLSRSELLNSSANLNHKLKCKYGNFNDIPFKDNEFDSIYSIEAICHSDNKFQTFKEIFRVLKPGSLFGFYDWCLTERYDERSKTHKKIINGIKLGNGLPDILTIKKTLEWLKMSGFELLEWEDLAEDSIKNRQGKSIQWYKKLESNFSFNGFSLTPIGRNIINWIIWPFEKLKIGPKGACEMHKLLSEGASCLVEGGRKKIFTPLLFVLARKPIKANKY